MSKVSRALNIISECHTLKRVAVCKNSEDIDQRGYRREFAQRIYLLFKEVTKDLVNNINVGAIFPYEVRVVANSLPINRIREIGLSAKEFSSLYEQIISLNLSEPTWNDLHQKTSGVYYTDEKIAFQFTRQAIDTYINNRLGIKDYSYIVNPPFEIIKLVEGLIYTTKIADPSCGVGRFLLAYLEYIKSFLFDYLDIDVRKKLCAKLGENISGYDVDPTALGLARLSLASELHRLWSDVQLSSLVDNLVQMNPLVQSNSTVNVDPFSFISGFLYHRELGRSQNFPFGQLDVVLGNPPWEKIRFEEKEHLESALPGYLSSATLKSDRKNLIQMLQGSHPKLDRHLKELYAHIENAKKLIKTDPVFANSAQSELNTGALFLELAARMVKSDSGIVGFLIKSSTLTHFANRQLFAYLKLGIGIISVFDFTNRKNYFPIDSRERFSWAVLGKNEGCIQIGMNLEEPEQMWDREKTARLTNHQVELLSPSSDVLPCFSNVNSLKVILGIYAKNKTFLQEYSNARFGRLVHLTTHTEDILKKPIENSLPILEGKFIDRFDGLFADFSGISEQDRYKFKALGSKILSEQKNDPSYHPEYRYFIRKSYWERLTKNHQEEYSLFWRSTTSATNRRTCIASILPHSPAIQSLQMLQLKNGSAAMYGLLLATMNSKAFDYLVRNRLTGIDLTQNVIKQIAVPNDDIWKQEINFFGILNSLRNHVLSRVRYLLCNDQRLVMFCSQLPDEIKVRGKSRHQIDMELDLLLGVAYQISIADLLDIIKCFSDYSDSIYTTFKDNYPL